MSYTSGKFAAQAKQVAVDDKAGRPENTILVYRRRKMAEFLDFSVMPFHPTRWMASHLQQ